MYAFLFIRIRTPYEDISCIPSSPGIYRFIDAQQEILYIGASKNLQNRISQYFRNSKFREKKYSQIQKLTRYIEYQEFETEESAFEAERLQIWTNNPKLNIRSNGIQSFSYLIFRKEPYFHLLCSSNDKIYRFTEHDRVYRINLHSKKLQELIDQIRRNLKLCTSSNEDSCWEYQLNLCYRNCLQSNRLAIEKGINNISKLINTLTSNDLTLLNEWNTHFDRFVEKMQFEEALKFHISLQALELLRRRFAGISFPLDQNRFIFTFPEDIQNEIQTTIYSYHDGRLISEEHQNRLWTKDLSLEVFILYFLQEYYQKNTILPKKVTINYQLTTKNQLRFRKWMRRYFHQPILLEISSEKK